MDQAASTASAAFNNPVNVLVITRQHVLHSWKTAGRRPPAPKCFPFIPKKVQVGSRIAHSDVAV